MGQKTHPLGIRIKAIENNFFFKKIGKFNVGSIFYRFYDYSFKNKSIFGRKLVYSFIIEKIINFFFLKILYFVNKIFIVENSTSFSILIEFFSIQKKTLSKKFKKQLSLLQTHISSHLTDKKKIQLFIVNLETKFLNKNIKINTNIKNNFIKNKNNSKILISVGLLNNFWCCAVLFSKIFSYFFKKTAEHQKILDFTDQLFFFLFNQKDSNFTGIRIEVKGRINGSDRSKKRVCSQGSLPLQSFRKIILSYGFFNAVTPYGSFGVRVYFSYKFSF